MAEPPASDRNARATGANGAGSSRDPGELVARLRPVRLKSGATVWTGDDADDPDTQYVLRRSSEAFAGYVLFARHRPTAAAFAEEERRAKRARAAERRRERQAEALARRRADAAAGRPVSALSSKEGRALEIVGRLGPLPERGDDVPDF